MIGIVVAFMVALLFSQPLYGNSVMRTIVYMSQAMFYIEYGLAQVAAARSGAPGLVCEGVTPPRSRSRNAIDSRRRSTGMAFPRSTAPDDSGRTDR